MNVNKYVLLSYIFLLAILVALGVWQLNRAEEKRVLITQQAQSQNNHEYYLNEHFENTLKPLRFRKIKAIGSFDSEHQFLLDNQHYQNKVGYFVIAPFHLQGDRRTLLVNRGWVPLGNSRSELPKINVTTQEITLEGRINEFPRVGLKLSDAEIPTKNWPALIQVVNVSVLADHLNYPVLDMQLELVAPSQYGFVRDWQQASTMTTEKHTAYAVQWFLLAITLTILFVKYGITKSNGSS